jgi:hypothetical protein
MYYTFGLFIISIFGSLLIIFATRNTEINIIGFALTVILTALHIPILKRYYNKFELYILSFYDEKGIPYKINSKVFENLRTKTVEE